MASARVSQCKWEGDLQDLFVLHDLLLQRSFCGWKEFSGRDFGQIRSSEFLPSSMAQALLFPDAHPRVLSSYYVRMRGAPLFFFLALHMGQGGTLA